MVERSTILCGNRNNDAHDVSFDDRRKGFFVVQVYLPDVAASNKTGFVVNTNTINIILQFKHPFDLKWLYNRRTRNKSLNTVKFVSDNFLTHGLDPRRIGCSLCIGCMFSKELKNGDEIMRTTHKSYKVNEF